MDQVLNHYKNKIEKVSITDFQKYITCGFVAKFLKDNYLSIDFHQKTKEWLESNINEIKDYKLVGIDNSLYYKSKKKNGPPSDHYGVYSNLLLKE